MAGPSTVLLGQFTDEHAEELTASLEDAGIVHWVKRSGGLARVLFAGDWGTRVFVDEGRAEEASVLAQRIVDGQG